EDELHILTHCLLAAKIAIAYRWKQQQSPKLTEVLTRLDTTCNFERMASRLRSKEHIFARHWQRWAQFRDQPES
ncbi:Hypothetical predicted protein, partial [Pelobates cultripes]